MSDQGLREALEKACKIAEARGRLKVPVIGLRELLAAHPAESVGSPRPVIDREALERLAAEWKTSADEDERYLNRAHASEIHDVYASIRINREHAAAVLALLGESEADS